MPLTKEMKEKYTELLEQFNKENGIHLNVENIFRSLTTAFQNIGAITEDNKAEEINTDTVPEKENVIGMSEKGSNHPWNPTKTKYLFFDET